MNWVTETIRFPEVRHTGRKNLPCPGCRKKVRRQRTFSNTINPWNKNPDGIPRTRDEILEKLRLQAAAWEQEPETCRECS